MENKLFNPVLNSPYEAPERHWALTENGELSEVQKQGRRPSLRAVPVTRKARKSEQGTLDFTYEDEQGRGFAENSLVNGIRAEIDRWRREGDTRHLTHETARLLEYWRSGRMTPQPFFCQLEAVETVIWLSEVAPNTASGKRWRQELEEANALSDASLFRIAAKMATGSGKTTVMAMLIAWQTVNAARGRRRFSDGFLIICPGITIRDRLKVLDPSDPENYFTTRRLVPEDMLADIRKVRIVIANYHAFKLRDRRQEFRNLSPYGEAVLQGRGEEIHKGETDDDMLRRACGDLLGKKNVIVINDEAHHCYAEKEGKSEEGAAGDEREDIKKNRDAARLWISGIRALDRKIGVRAVYDLSATPFFLRGSGHPEGTLFPWVVSDFSLLDAIESGIVKIPRVPVTDNSLGYEMPVWRRLWPEIRDDMPKAGAKKAGPLPVSDIPEKLLGALHGLYEHYEAFSAKWQGHETPPVFIVVCQNTSHSKLLFDYIAGYETTETTAEGEERTYWIPGKLPLFSNLGADGKPLTRPNTLLIDSHELESGEALSADFRKLAAAEISAFKQEMADQHGQGTVEKLTDADLLREAMNTVGRPGRLGAQVRCVVSVSMLTEGWDANTVTHILGVRAFGTELLCEQVVGRGLRRTSYEAGDDGLFAPEYAHIFGIPFTFASDKGGGEGPPPPKPTTRVHALRERVEADPALEIRFPRVQGYRVRLPKQLGDWRFTDESRMRIDPELTPSQAKIEDLLGVGETITLENWMDQRLPTAAFHVAGFALRQRFRDDEGNLRPWLFPRLLAAAKDWLATHVNYGDSYGPGVFLWQPVARRAADKLYSAFVLGAEEAGDPVVLPVLHPFNPEGSTNYVDFRTSKPLHETDPAKSHVSHVAGDSEWEIAVAQAFEEMDEVRAYVKNQALDFEVPYLAPGNIERRYLPDFIVKIDDGRDDLLNLIVEVKGKKDALADIKAEAVRTHWLPAIRNDGRFGRWEYVMSLDPYRVKQAIRDHLEGMG